MPLDVCWRRKGRLITPSTLQVDDFPLGNSNRTFFIMTPKTQDWAPELLITTYQKEECDEFLFSRFDYKPDSEDEKKA